MILVGVLRLLQLLPLVCETACYRSRCRPSLGRSPSRYVRNRSQHRRLTTGRDAIRCHAFRHLARVNCWRPRSRISGFTCCACRWVLAGIFADIRCVFQPAAVQCGAYSSLSKSLVARISATCDLTHRRHQALCLKTRSAVFCRQEWRTSVPRPGRIIN